MKFLGIIILSVLAIMIGCNDNSTEPNTDDLDSNVVVRKPNLYIYPESEINLNIKIDFPLGGEIIDSHPHYDEGWFVNVNPDGMINDEYGYLFYEFTVPDFYQKDFGWIVEKNNLEDFFRENMKTAGFSEIEISDFIEYWIPELIDFPFYAIYPQFRNTVDLMTEIQFSVEVDHLYRLHYYLEGLNNQKLELEKPIMVTSRRKGFYAMEWGVIIQ